MTQNKSKIFFVSFLLLSFFLVFNQFGKRNSLLATVKKNDSLVKDYQENIPENNLDNSLEEINKNIFSQIPSHINIYDFYNSYGERLLGDENLKIYSREEWQADEAEKRKDSFISLKDNDPESSLSLLDYWRLKEILINYQKNFADYDNFFLKTLKKENGVTYQYLPVEEIIIHHTAGKMTFSFEDTKKEIQNIYLVHKYSRQWSDIGYHFLIDGKGRIFEGSLGGKYSLGAHTFYHNKANIAIALMGNFQPGHDQITPEMKDSLIKLIQYLISQYQLNLSEKNFYLRKADFSSREYTDKFIKGHKELDFTTPITECPGINPDQLRTMIYPFIFQ